MYSISVFFWNIINSKDAIINHLYKIIRTSTLRYEFIFPIRNLTDDILTVPLPANLNTIWQTVKISL